VWMTTAPGWEIYYAMLDTAGNFLVDTMKIVCKPPSGGAEYPRIAIDDSNLARVCWDDARGTSWDVYYKWQLWDPEVSGGSNQSQTQFIFPSPASRLELKLSRKTKIEIFDVMGRKLIKTTAHPPSSSGHLPSPPAFTSSNSTSGSILLFW